MPAIVLAADRGPSDPVARAAGVASKCLAPVVGIAMIERVVTTLAASPWVGRIIVVQNARDDLMQCEVLARLAKEGRLFTVAAEPTPSLSALRGIDMCADEFPILITTADHPLLTGEVIEYFSAHAFRSGADIAAGVVAASLIRNRFPDAVRTYLNFRDGGYSGANLFALLGPDGKKAVAFWRRVETQRKRPWRIAKVFGWRLLAGYLTRTWTLDGALERASARLGVKAYGVKIPYAEAAVDVDKPADLVLAERILGASG